jgi:hypothetical protein
MADWKVFKLEIPGKDLLEPVREVLQTLLIFLEILKAILETIKAFLIDFGNPIRALVEALIQLILELFEALKATGLFAYFDVPNVFEDPSFARQRGGFEGFKTRFKASLFDLKDFNRPQPRPGSTTGGFVLLAVVANDIGDIIDRLLALLRFFGKGWDMPRYGAPANLKVAAVGTGGSPILDVAKVFTDGPIEAIELTWTLGTTVESPNPGFGDAVTKMAAEFAPNNWLIEKSAQDNPVGQKVDLSEIGDDLKTGIVTIERETDFAAGPGGRFVGNEKQPRREALRDQYGEPVIKFHSYTAVDVTPGGESNVGFTLSRIAGKYRILDTDVFAGLDYYYRVTAYTGTLDVDGNGRLNVPTQVKQLNQGADVKQNYPHWDWPGENVVMGVPSKIIRAAVPVDLAGFDVFESLRRLFLVAFSLDFHQPQLDDAEFDNEGYPEAGTPITRIGRGSLEGLGDGLREIASFVVVDVLGAAGSIYEAWDPDQNPFLVEGVPPEMPWQDSQVRLDAARLANIVASAMLQLGDVVYTYRNIMTGPLPRGAVAAEDGHEPSRIRGLGTLDEVTEAFIQLEFDEATKRYVVDLQGAQTFYLGYNEDPELRLNILTAINFIKTFTLGGIPPDWISISPLRDIIPWSADIIYKLLDAIDALLAAFAGIIEEIKAFIDLLIRKIEALEALIQVLIDILNFIESLAISAYMLIVPEVSGGAEAWVELSPRDFAAGIGLAYVAADISAFSTAFSIIFGAA